MRPCGWTESSGCFDRLPGVLILELHRAEIAERAMQGLCFGLGHGQLGLTGSIPTGERLARAMLRDVAIPDLSRFAPNALAMSGDTGRRMFHGAKS